MKIKKIILFLLVIIGIMCFVAISYLKNIDTISLNTDTSINIPSGSSTKQIATVLYDNSLIKNKEAFVLYIKINDIGTQLKSGNYTFKSGEITFNDITQKLIVGGADENSIFVTVPEGLTVLQIAELFESKGFDSKDTFLETAKNLDVPFDYIDKPGDYKRLEGFLFPETYNIPVKYDSEKIIIMMLNEFDKHFSDEYKTRAKELGYSINEIITIASLIEREARVEFERPLISSVIHNRLQIDMPLQIDATIQYILGKQKDRILYADLEIKSPYNTYLNKGLPPTPIAVPGKSCIDAALYPEETEYFYYRTKSNGSGEHNFSKTFNEHIENGKK